MLLDLVYPLISAVLLASTTAATPTDNQWKATIPHLQGAIVALRACTGDLVHILHTRVACIIRSVIISGGASYARAVVHPMRKAAFRLTIVSVEELELLVTLQLQHQVLGLRIITHALWVEI